MLANKINIKLIEPKKTGKRPSFFIYNLFLKLNINKFCNFENSIRNYYISVFKNKLSNLSSKINSGFYC